MLCAARGAGELGGWAANLLCHRTPGLALSRVDLRRQLAASTVWCFVRLWEGRQKAQSPVNAASLGSAASLMNVPGVCCKGFSIASSSARRFSGAGRDCFTAFLLEFRGSVHDGAQGGWTCAHRWPMAAAVVPGSLCSFGCGFLHKVGPGSLWMPDTGRPGGPGSGASRPLLFAPSSWKWTQSEG